MNRATLLSYAASGARILKNITMVASVFAIPVAFGYSMSVYSNTCTRRYSGVFSNNCQLDKTLHFMASTALSVFGVGMAYVLDKMYWKLKDMFQQADNERQLLDRSFQFLSRRSEFFEAIVQNLIREREGVVVPMSLEQKNQLKVKLPVQLHGHLPMIWRLIQDLTDICKPEFITQLKNSFADEIIKPAQVRIKDYIKKLKLDIIGMESEILLLPYLLRRQQEIEPAKRMPLMSMEQAKAKLDMFRKALAEAQQELPNPDVPRNIIVGFIDSKFEEVRQRRETLENAERLNKNFKNVEVDEKYYTDHSDIGFPFKALAKHGKFEIFEDDDGNKIEAIIIKKEHLTILEDAKGKAINEANSKGEVKLITYDGRIKFKVEREGEDITSAQRPEVINQHIVKLLKQAHASRDTAAQMLV